MAPLEDSLPSGKAEEHDPPAGAWSYGETPARSGASPRSGPWARQDANGTPLSVRVVDREPSDGVAPLPALTGRLPEVRAVGLIPVLSVESRDGRMWVVSNVERGAPLRRVLSVAALTPPQACLLSEGLLTAIARLHEVGAAHGRLDADSVLVGLDGTVWLRDWALSELAGQERAPRVAADVAAACTLLQQLSRVALARVAHEPEGTVDGLLALRGLAGRTWAGVDQLLEELRNLVAPLVPDRGRTLTELRAIAHALREDDRFGARAEEPETEDPEPDPGNRPPVRRDRAFERPDRPRRLGLRPPRRSGVLVLSLLSVALLALTVLVYGPGPAARHDLRLPGGITLQVPSPHVPVVHLPLLSGRGTAEGASSTPGARTDAGHQPRPAPTLAPASAGPVSAILVQPVRPDCPPQDTCPLRVDVQLTPAPHATQVTWTLEAFDRCTGTLHQLPGGSATALAGWPYVSATSSLPATGPHPAAVFAVTTSPARASSPPLLLPTPGAGCE
ncbi:MAG: hypothetical protein J2P40_03720 [Candidatus Dormibacteraeota bacterium]|nr:hypothetical protein [Candidatus Dormibacteraeota bacterium]